MGVGILARAEAREQLNLHRAVMMTRVEEDHRRNWLLRQQMLAGMKGKKRSG